MSTPWKAATCSATRVVVTGSATVPPRALGGDQVEHDEQGPLVVDRRAPSRRPARCAPPPGRSARRTRPWTTRPAGRAGQRLERARPRDSVGDVSSRPLLTVSTSRPSRPSRVGRTSDAVPPPVSTTTLRPCLRQAGHVDLAQQLEGVGLHHPRRERAGRRSRRGTRGGTRRGRRCARACAGRPATGRRRAGRGRRCRRSRAARAWSGSRRRRPRCSARSAAGRPAPARPRGRPRRWRWR